MATDATLMAIGSVLPMAKAQARPAMTAIASERGSGREGDKNDVANMTNLRSQ
jgi:hypothetical protein